MTSWIFQGNPKSFDIDAYLEECNSSILWLVRQHAREIATGDTVYLWRSEGDQKQPGGVIAELEVVEPVMTQADDPDSLKFWIGESGKATGRELTLRVRLRLIRLASKREVLKRNWLKDDAVLKDLGILKMAQHTNYSLKLEESTRLRALWDNTGHDWTRDESIAALCAYDKQYGSPISMKPDSIVSKTAQQIGRATTGVYNKLMNFRSLDPRVDQKGLEGSSSVDKIVWNEFYDVSASAISSPSLEREYQRLWGDTNSPPLADTSRAAYAEEVRRLETRSLSDLVAGFNATRNISHKPARHASTVAAFRRDPRVGAITRLRANFKCEIPDCGNHQFLNLGGESYIETHHLRTLADGGADVPENTVAVCPNHHRELHHGRQRDVMTKQLLTIRQHDLALTHPEQGIGPPVA